LSRVKGGVEELLNVVLATAPRLPVLAGVAGHAAAALAG